MKLRRIVPGLRVALAHRRGDPSAQGVGGAGIVLDAVAKVRVQVARRGEADAVDLRVLGGVDQLVQVGGIESALQAELRADRVCREKESGCNRRTPSRRCATGRSLPSSEVRRVSVALEVSKLAGSAVPATPPRRIGNVVASAGMSLKRASTRPVMLEPSGSWRPAPRASRHHRPADVALPAAGDQHVARFRAVGEESAASQIDAAAVRDEVEQHAAAPSPCRPA